MEGTGYFFLVAQHWASAFQGHIWAHIGKWQSLTENLGFSLLVDQYNSSPSLSTLPLHGLAGDQQQVGELSISSKCHDF